MMKIKQSIFLCLVMVFTIQVSVAAQKIIPGAQAITYGNNQFLILTNSDVNPVPTQTYFTDGKGAWKSSVVLPPPPPPATAFNLVAAVYGKGFSSSNGFTVLGTWTPIVWNYLDGQTDWTKNKAQVDSNFEYMMAAYDGKNTTVALLTSQFFPELAPGSQLAVFNSDNTTDSPSAMFGTSDVYNALAFGQLSTGTRLVAVGKNGVVGISDNYNTAAISMTTQASKVAEHLQSIAFGNNEFVAVGDNRATEISPDGINWTAHYVPTIINFKAVAYGNNIWVAVGSNEAAGAPTILYSNDGANWLAANYYSNMIAVAYGNGEFMAINANGAIVVSTNGRDWSDAL